jgi:importin-4
MNPGSVVVTTVDPQSSQAVVSLDHLMALLRGLTQPDTGTIRQAELALKPLLKQPATMFPLWHIVSNTANEVGVRHVGAIVLRKRLPTHYSTMDARHKEEWQNQVLQALAVEPVRPVRSGLVGVAAALAHVEGAATPTFLNFLSAAANNDANSRELCFLLLNEMTETIGTHWKAQLPDLTNLFFAVLNNAGESHAVHKAAVQALGRLMSYWAEDEDEIAQLAPLLPLALQIASHVSDEDFLAAVLDVLYDLAYSPADALQPHLTIILQFALACVSNRDLELRVRDAAALVIATTAEAKPKTVGKSPALPAILDVLFQLMQDSPESAAGALFETNPSWRADLDDSMAATDEDDLDSPTETSMAQGTLDMLACEVPKKYIWKEALNRCIGRMSDATNPQARKAGVAGLGVIAEGCAEQLTASLASILPYVFAAAQDPAAQVRECACFCLGQISEHCQPDILQYSSQILPIVFGLLDDTSVAVQVTSCYVLEMFCERLEPNAVRPHLDSLVRKLTSMLETTTKRSVQEMTVAALAATAVAAEEEFAPYVPGVANLISKLLLLQDPNLFTLRGRALEFMGHMAIAVGRDTFRPFFPATMQCAMEGLTTDSTELQEFAYAVFANLAKVMKDEFSPALPELVPHLLQVIDQDEGQLEEAEDKDGEYGALDDSDDEEGGNMVLHVRTALLEVKKGAITALGEMAAHTGTAFCPYLEACLESLKKSADNWHPIIKSEVADALPALIVPSVEAYHQGELKWKKGDVHGPNPLSAHTFALAQAVLNVELELMEGDDKIAAGKACEAVQTVIELCGPHAFAPLANELLAAVHSFLTKTAKCYTEDAYFGELPDDDDDHDVVMQAACDLVGAFARVLGQHFVQYLPQFLPPICEYGKSSRPSSDRSMSVGCLSELAQELEGGIEAYWKSVFLPAVVAGLADEDENVKRNSVFCAGVCCEHLRERAAADYPTILHGIWPIFSLDASTGDDSVAACMDNAAAAVARMIMACQTHVPLAQVLPSFLRALPLKTDMTENETVYTCILGLLQMNQPDIVAHKQEVQRIFREACGASSQVDDETKAKLLSALQAL